MGRPGNELIAASVKYMLEKFQWFIYQNFKMDPTMIFLKQVEFNNFTFFLNP